MDYASEHRCVVPVILTTLSCLLVARKEDDREREKEILNGMQVYV